MEINNGSVIISVRVQPRAPRTDIVGELDGKLKIRLAAPPVDGEANAELIRYLAQIFNLQRKEIEIISGEKSRNKQVRISGVSVDQCEIVLKEIEERLRNKRK
ncbi:MAG: DUF167 domain-containing protein [Acidobacteria bacterium]|nr:DUF167 domain-containing protein [Acidobacteriota bacterium]